MDKLRRPSVSLAKAVNTAWRPQVTSLISSRCFSSAREKVKSNSSSGADTKSFHYFDPLSILPSGHKQIRILNNTVRDAQQSNLSAEMAEEHRQYIGEMINDVYKNISGLPGYEQIWGGTVPMYDIWKRGVQPFISLKKMCSTMPNTPASALIRSNALNGMSAQPKDVVDVFIKHAVKSGVNVFTNFDAHNDWRNHVNVAEAVHKYGGHYQAAISWAVYKPDPTVYNVQWAIDFFRDAVKMGAHSLYVKDPAGVLTPEMAGVLAAEIKSTFPDLPLIFHTHYQTGFAYMSYLEAARNGANGVECSLGFADGSGQPFGLSMLRVFEDMGFDTGNPDKQAMQRITDECKDIRELYEHGRIIRTPDIRIEETGIAGGQRTILDKELIEAGQPHLVKLIDQETRAIRDEGGIVCQVTPVADAYAREATRRLRGGDPNKNFTAGYMAILTGTGGLVKEPVNAEKREQALLQRGLEELQSLVKADKISTATASKITEGNIAQLLRDQMLEQVEPIECRARIAEIESRLDQLKRIQAKPHLLESLNRKIMHAQAVDKDKNPIRTIDDRIRLLQQEFAALKSRKFTTDIGDAEYDNIINRKPSDSTYKMLLDGNPAIKQMIASGELTEDAHKSLLSAFSLITCCFSDTIPPGLPSAAEEIQKIDQEHVLGLTDDPEEFEELVVLQAMFGKALISHLMLNFFKNYKENPEFWEPTYDKKEEASAKAPVAQESHIKRRGVHSIVEKAVGDQLLDTLKGLYSNINELNKRLRKLRQNGSPHATLIARLEKEKEAQQLKYQTSMSEAKKKLAKIVGEHPGVFIGKLPSQGKASPTTVDSKSEIECATQYLQEFLRLSLH